jgi:hypothetical protein
MKMPNINTIRHLADGIFFSITKGELKKACGGCSGEDFKAWTGFKGIFP